MRQSTLIECTPSYTQLPLLRETGVPVANRNRNRTVVLASGGLDSSFLLWYFAKEVKHETVAFFVDYGQKHSARELGAVSQQVQALHDYSEAVTIVRRELDPQMFGRDSALLRASTTAVPSMDYDDMPIGPGSTEVPFRNATLLSLAVSYAMQMDMLNVAIGIHKGDSENWAYPDCSPAFFDNMKGAVNIGSNGRVRSVAPLLYRTKAEIIRLGEDVGVPWELTWSCYVGGRWHCGECPTCRERMKAFALAEVEDPTPYREV